MTDIAEMAFVLCLVISAIAWFYLIFLHGGFWRDGPYLSTNIPAPRDWPSVVAVVPARNEAETIAATLTALAAQDYPGAFAIILVDDQSDDRTQERAREARGMVPPVSIVAGTPLPHGWTGKMWAVAQGIEAVRRQNPDAKYLFLTDADITHEPSVLRDLVAKAERDRLALVSQMVLLRSESFWEKLLIPAFIYFFKKLYPFARINDPRTTITGAAGGCMLVQREALDLAGGIQRIKGEIIDDCALARTLKPMQPIWLGLTRHSRSLRRYDHFSDIWGMVTRTAFVQLRHSLWLLAGTVLGMMLIYLVPPTAAIGGLLFGAPINALCGLSIWIVMGLSYIPTLRLYDLPLWYAALLPLAAVLYTLMTIGAAYMTLLGNGPSWKDRRHGMDAGTS